MTRLFVANCTKHVQEFLYRLPESQQINREVIQIGTQKEIYKDASVDVMEYIIKQHVIYGLIPLSEIDRTKGFFGMCFSFDKHINVEQIMRAIQHNEEEMIKKAYEHRKLDAAALSHSIDQTLQGSDQKLQSVEFEVHQEDKKGDTPATAKVDEVIQVAKPGSKAAARGPRAAEQQGR